MIMGAVLAYPGSVDNYSMMKAENLMADKALAYSEEFSADEQVKEMLEDELKVASTGATDGVVVPFPTVQKRAEDFYRSEVVQKGSSRLVLESLLMRENASSGTTEANAQLAEIKIGANEKLSDEQERRSLFFDPTLLAQRVKADRDFLTGKMAVGSSFDVALS